MKVALVLIVVAFGFGVWNFATAPTHDGRTVVGIVLLVLAGIRIFTLPDRAHESENDRDV